MCFNLEVIFSLKFGKPRWLYTTFKLFLIFSSFNNSKSSLISSFPISSKPRSFNSMLSLELSLGTSSSISDDFLGSFGDSGESPDEEPSSFFKSLFQ